MDLDWALLGLRLLATVVIYSFLGVAFYIIWRDLRSTEYYVMVQTGGTPRLRILAAPDDNQVGDAVPVLPQTVLGRHRNNTVVIEAEAVAQRHARLQWINGHWWLEDMGSRAGTLLNDTQLSKPARLTHGDVIGIGPWRFRLEME